MVRSKDTRDSGDSAPIVRHSATRGLQYFAKLRVFIFHFGSPRIGASDSKGKQKGENDDCNTLIGPVMQWLRRKTSNLKVLSSNLDAARGPVPRSRATRAGRAPGPVRDDGRRGAEQSGSGEGKGEGEG